MTQESINWNHAQSVKEVIRHVAFNLGASGFLDNRRRRKGSKMDHLKARTTAERFRAIYELGVWLKHDGQKSLSGTGSEEASTTSVRSELVRTVQELHCQTFLDVGCGDWTWMKKIALPCAYIGVDIVADLIKNNQHYARSGVSFEVVDAISGPLPAADIALCREILFHLSFRDSLAVLKNIRRASKWLIATTDPPIWFNSDIRTGDFRMINLQKRPYNLPEPHTTIRDDSIVGGRVLGVWPTACLPSTF